MLKESAETPQVCCHWAGEAVCPPQVKACWAPRMLALHARVFASQLALVPPLHRQDCGAWHSRPPRLLAAIQGAAAQPSAPEPASRVGSPAAPDEHAVHHRLSEELDCIAAAARAGETARPANLPLAAPPVPRPVHPRSAGAHEDASSNQSATVPSNRASRKRAMQQQPAGALVSAPQAAAAPPAKRSRSSGPSSPLTNAGAAAAPLVPTPPLQEQEAASQQQPAQRIRIYLCRGSPPASFNRACKLPSSLPPSRAPTPVPASGRQLAPSHESQAIAQLEARKQALQQQLALLQRQLVTSLLSPMPALEQPWPLQHPDRAALPAAAMGQHASTMLGQQGAGRHVAPADAGTRPPACQPPVVPAPAVKPAARNWQQLQRECQEELQALADQEADQEGSDGCSSASSSSPSSSQRRHPGLTERLERAERMLRASAALTRCPLSRVSLVCRTRSCG